MHLNLVSDVVNWKSIFIVQKFHVCFVKHTLRAGIIYLESFAFLVKVFIHKSTHLVSLALEGHKPI